MDAPFAWRLFFKALSDGERRSGYRWTGDERLAAAMAATLAVMA
jgi:hypothetical protein